MKSMKISAAFLSALLVAGTIAALFPSFMIGAQADPYYGMDKDNKKVEKKISVSSLKCNNINVNVNGLTLDVFPPFLGGGDIAAEAAEPSTDASSFAGNGGNDKSEFNDFRFICINNNNNTVIEEQKPPVDPCEDCFAQNLVDIIDVEDALAGGIEIIILVPEGATTIEIFSFADLCNLIEENPRQIITILQQVFDAVGGPEIPIDTFDAIVDCIITALGLDTIG